MIGVINYKAGNATSVMNALRKIEIEACLVSTSAELESVSGIILPGVGSARATIDSLTELDLIGVLENKVLEEKLPFLGICVGFQILFDHSAEGDAKCLGWIKGKVKQFPSNVRVPQMGWNIVNFKGDSPLFNDLSEQEYFYFVNSYYVVPEDDQIVVGTTNYGSQFCSMVAFDNIVACQFHVEKSGNAGLKMLHNFSLMAGGKTDVN